MLQSTTVSHRKKDSDRYCETVSTGHVYGRGFIKPWCLEDIKTAVSGREGRRETERKRETEERVRAERQTEY